ncbi:MAG: Electron transport complex subunit RsxD [Phycisphaerae bacterium]|nr:Electron transport complex subunit RsxD [Phycisphaerae bacterium]
MVDRSASPAPNPLPRAARTIERPPHWRASETGSHIFWTSLYAAGLPTLAGLAFFGWAGLWVLALSVGSVAATEWLFVGLARRPSHARHGGHQHTLLLGLLLGLTLPATVNWQVVVLAGVVTVVVGKGLLGGLGHYLWHPALIGRFVVQVLFYDQLSPDKGWLLLDRHHLFFGNLHNAAVASTYSSWAVADAAPGASAFSQGYPLAPIAEMAHGSGQWIHHAVAQTGQSMHSSAGEVLFRLTWDRLPALGDMIIGAVPGNIGATCAVALVVGGMLLMYHGHVRWQLVGPFLLAAALAAAICPLRIAGPTDHLSWQWLPGFVFYNRMPVGPVYVAFHMVSGELLLGCFFFAGDMVSRPITKSGQVIFGAGCGALAIVLRLYLFMPGGAYIAILLMNTLTPVIDRITQPRAFGH